MKSYVAAFSASLVLSVLLTPAARAIAFRLGAVVHPRSRDVHQQPMPRLGGVAIAASLLAPVGGLLLTDSSVAQVMHVQWKLVLGLFLGGVLACGVGAVDDVRGVRPLYKLAAQVLAATVAFSLGFRIDGVTLPFFGTLYMGAFAYPVTVLWIVGVTNAVNLIDGLDGLAAGVVFFAAFTNFVVAYLSQSIFVGLVMASMMGAVLGFLFYNFNPARIFMGDSGSYFLGYVLSISALVGAAQKASTTVALLVPMVALGVPIFDTLFSMLRRTLERRPIFSPDRGHIHHRLMDLGLTQRRAVLLLYGVTVLFTAASIAIAIGRSWEIGAALVAVTVLMLGLVRFVGYFDYLHLRRRQKYRLYDERTDRLRRLIPEVLQAAGDARNEAQLFAVLDRLAGAAGMARLRCLSFQDEVEPAHEHHVWSDAEGRLRDIDTAVLRFPVGADARARTKLEFVLSGGEDASPQVDILLQLVADAVASGLLRLDSPLAPRRPTIAPARASSLDQLAEPAPQLEASVRPTSP